MNKIEWNKFTDPLIQNGLQLLMQINAAGFEAYVAGGAVRDIAMGDDNIHDIDIATNMPIDVIKKTFHTIEYGTGEVHGTVIVHFKNNDYELTQFRTEGTYSDNRRPDDVKFVQSFEEDTKRRDFTINAMGIDFLGQVIDYQNGIDDIEAGIIRTVGDARERFGEDSLRLMRAIRFAARFDFKIDDDTLNIMRELKHTISGTSIERIRDELTKTIGYGGAKFANALYLLEITGLWDVIIPEVPLSMTVIHIIQMMHSDDVRVNFAILFNKMDIHEIKTLGKRLRLTNAEIKTITFIIKRVRDYPQLDILDKSEALEIVSDADFHLLRSLWIGVSGKDIDNADEIIEKINSFNAIRERRSMINTLIMCHGIKGSAFGLAINSVNKWLFAEFEKGNEPSDKELESFIGKL